jgi:hypothetical protein
MPNFNGTGPQGIGAMTGRGLGYCRGGMQGCFGKGYTRSFGFRRRITLTKEEEKKILEAELKEIDLEKQEIEKKLKEIK